MAKLSFPPNPTSGQTFVGSNQIAYVFDGVKWIGVSGGSTGNISIDTGNVGFSGDNLYNTQNNAINLASATTGAEAFVQVPAQADVDAAPLVIANQGEGGVVIQSQNDSWVIQDGKLTIPPGGDIVDSDNNSVLIGASLTGAAVEMFKVNYGATGEIVSITNATSGINSVTINNAIGGDITVTLNSLAYRYPPASIMLYGYDHGNNKYIMSHMETTMASRELPAGGTSGSPTLFDGESVVTMRLRVREAETGASRSFGSTTHAWVQMALGA